MLEFRILGPLEVWRDGERVALEAPRERAVLAALLLHANRVVAADHLIELLWPEGTAPATARNTLHTWVWKLRRRLEPPKIFETRSPGYLLHLEPDQLDLFRFEELLRRGRQALGEGSAAQASQLLGEAVRLWRGTPLADVAAERLREVEGAGLAELYLPAVQARVAADLALGRHAELIGELRGLVAEHPLSEDLCAQLMTALYRSGRQADALAAFRAQRAVLAHQLGVEPGPALQRLHQAVLHADPALDAAPPPAAVTGTPAAAPAAVPAQLPAAVAAFTGRAAHLARLDELVADSDALVVAALTGTAGAGKTALAVHWAHRVRDRFPDGQLHVNLRGYDPGHPVTPAEALARFLRALGVAPDAVPTGPDEAAALYRSLVAGRRMLVLLDNAGSAEQVRPLLPGTAGCLVLVTSRDRLGGLVARDGARRIALDGLLPEESVALLARIVGAERVSAEPAAAAELAEQCGHLALALRIAAASLVNHPDERIADLVAELRTGDRLAMLSVDDDADSAVAAAFDQSYATLPADARHLFRCLGLVPGADFTADAAAALADTTHATARRLLDRLAGAHLVEPGPRGRFTLHDLLRAYALACGRREDGEPARRAATARLADRYLRQADAAARQVHREMLRTAIATDPRPGEAPIGFASNAEALGWFETERANLVSLVVHTAAHGPARTSWQLAERLRGYFWARRHTGDWLTVAAAARTAAEAAGDVRGAATAEMSLAMAYRSVNRSTEAVEHNTRAVVLMKDAGWPEGTAAAMNNLGALLITAGRFTAAAEILAATLDLHERGGVDSPHRAGTLCNLGLVLLRLGRLREAEASLTEALERFGTGDGRVEVLQDLGETCHALGRFGRALEHLDAAAAAFRESGDLDGEAMTQCVRSAVHRDAGHHTDALDLARVALALAERTGDRYTESIARSRIGAAQLSLGHHLTAVEEYTRALALARQVDNLRAELEALIGLAGAERHLGRSERSRARAAEAVARARPAGLRVLEGLALAELAEAHFAAGRHDRAAEHAAAAVAVHEATGHRLGRARALVVLGTALRGRQRPAHWREALAIMTDIGAADAAGLRAVMVSADLTPA